MKKILSAALVLTALWSAEARGQVQPRQIVGTGSPSGAILGYTGSTVQIRPSSFFLLDKASVFVATAATLPAHTVVDGALVADANGTLTVDGQVLTEDARVLVKDETNQERNGIYVLTQEGSGSAPWILARADDASAAWQLRAGVTVFVRDGDVNFRRMCTLRTDVDNVGVSTALWGCMPVSESLFSLANLSGTVGSEQIGADAVELGAKTFGNYVQSITTSAVTGLTGGLAAAEGTAHTLAFDYTATLAADPALAAGACVFGTTGLICEGSSADGFETLIVVTDPTADRTLTLPNATGTLVTLEAASNTFTGNLLVNGNATIGDATSDTHTINGPVTVTVPSAGKVMITKNANEQATIFDLVNTNLTSGDSFMRFVTRNGSQIISIGVDESSANDPLRICDNFDVSGTGCGLTMTNGVVNLATGATVNSSAIQTAASIGVTIQAFDSDLSDLAAAGRGSAGQVYTSNGAGSAPTWQNASGKTFINCFVSTAMSVDTYVQCGNNGSSTTEASVDTFIVPSTCTAQRMYVDLGANLSGSQSWTFYLRDDGVSTGLSCTITGANSACSDLSNTAVIAAGSKITILADETVDGGSPTVTSITFECAL
jgi:hypothetical protein